MTYIGGVISETVWRIKAYKFCWWWWWWVPNMMLVFELEHLLSQKSVNHMLHSILYTHEAKDIDWQWKELNWNWMWFSKCIWCPCILYFPTMNSFEVLQPLSAQLAKPVIFLSGISTSLKIHINLSIHIAFL